MRGGKRWVALSLATGFLALTGAGTNAFAKPCDLLLAPISTSVRDRGIDAPREACGHSGYGGGLRALVLLDESNFYGTLAGSLFVHLRTLHPSGFEFSVRARAADYRFAQTAVFSGAEAHAGPIQVSALRARRAELFGTASVISQELVLSVPFTDSSWPRFALEAKPSYYVSAQLHPRMTLHVRGALFLQTLSTPIGPENRAALLSSADVGARTFGSLALVVGSEVQGGFYGLGLDHWLVRGGLRVRMGGEHGLELGVFQRLAGKERADGGVWLGYRHVAAPSTPKRSRLQDWAR